MRDVAPTRFLASGLGIALFSSAAFGVSGPFAKSLLESGWSPGAAVAVRLLGGALVLAVPAVLAGRRNRGALRKHWSRVASFGIVAMAICQVCYFNAVQHLSVGVALLLEYLAPVLLVGWTWLRAGNRPRALTIAGTVAAFLGLLLVLDLGGSTRVSLVGVLWGVGAAVCLAFYFVVSARNDDGVPPVVMAGGGMAVGSALGFMAGAAGIMPLAFSTSDAVLAGTSVPWVVPLVGLVLFATALSYVSGVMAARRLGSKVASFVSLTEVLFAVIFAWLMLGELPVALQLLGGLLIVAGVVLVRLDEVRSAPNARVAAAVVEALP